MTRQICSTGLSYYVYYCNNRKIIQYVQIILEISIVAVLLESYMFSTTTIMWISNNEGKKCY